MPLTHPNSPYRTGAILTLALTVLLPLLAPARSAERAPDAAALARMKELYENKRFFELRDLLKEHEGDRPAELLFYRGALANKLNQLDRSIDLLERCARRSEGQPEASWRRECYDLLAEGYAKRFEYRKAGETYRKIVQELGQRMTEREVASFENVAKLWGALAGAPRQKISFRGDTVIEPGKKSYGHTLPVEANGQNIRFVSDTGANISTIMASWAEKLGLRILPDSTISVGTITGKSVPARMGVAPRLRIGNVEVEHAVFLVMDDSALTFPGGFQIEGIIGYPVIAALREITFDRDGTVRIPARPRMDREQNLFLDGLKPYVHGSYRGRPLTFAFDTGASHTDLYVPFLRLFEEEIKKSGDPRPDKSTGAGGSRDVLAYTLKDLPLTVAGKEARLPRVKVQAEVINEDGSRVHGNLGQDFIQQFPRMTLSFQSMSLTFE